MFNLLITARSFGYASDRALNEFRHITDIQIERPFHELAFDEEKMVELVPGQDAVIVGTDKMTSRVISKADRLKFITKHGVGVDNVDIQAASEAGILVTNMPGINDRAVADMTMGLILALSRGICQANMQIKNHDWSKLLGNDVWGKVLGIVGTGNIGKEVIKRAQGFDMQIAAYDVFPDKESSSRLGFEYMELDELITSSDIISIHAPFLPETKDLITAQEFARMKPDAILINTSRGGIVNETDLLDALSDKTIAGAAIDVYQKSFPDNPKVYELENLVVTPHIAAYTFETLESMDMMLLEAYQMIMQGDLPANLNILNPEVLEN